jgi:autotransporter-associated beta strand protein
MKRPSPLLHASAILAILSSPALAQFAWLGQITGETDVGKRLTIHGGDAASLFQEANWNDPANPGSPAPNNTINTSAQSPAGLAGPILVDNGGVAGGTNGAGTSSAHLRSNGHAITVTGPGSGIKMTVEATTSTFRAMIQNDGMPGGDRSPLTIAAGAFVLTERLQDIAVTLSDPGSRLFIGSTSADHAGLENSTIALTGIDASSPEIHFTQATPAAVLAALANITINGSPANPGTDPFRIEPGDNILLTLRNDYAFANFKQLDAQFSGTTTGIAIRAITPLTPTYWDVNAAAPGAGGPNADGIWDLSTANWSSDLTGESATSAWTDSSVAAFAAGSDATNSIITLPAPRTLTGLLVESGDVTLTGANLQFASGAIHLGNAGLLNLDPQTLITGNPGLHIEKGAFLTLSTSQSLGPVTGDGSITTQDFETSLTFISTSAHTFGGTLGLAGILTKAGPGTLTLTRPQNSFSGDLVIAAGTLTLAKDQGNIATMGSFFSTDVRAGATWNLVGAPFTLSSLQTLKGAGTVAIANRTTWTGNTFASQIPTTISGLTISGTVEPGDSGPGTLTVTGGTVALAPSALLKLEINHATPAIHDRIALSHGLTIAAGATLELTVTGTLENDVYPLIQYSGTPPATPITVVNLPAGYELKQDHNGNTIALVKPTAGFAAWAAQNQIPGANFEDDGPDLDGIPNGIEYALGLNPVAFDTLPLPQKAGETLVWTLPKGALAASDPTLQYRFATSPNLSQWTPTAPTTQDATTFTLTLPAGPDRFFVRLLITTTAN